MAVAFVAHVALTPMYETDLFFHLKLGDVILTERAIPFRNLFSFTYPEYRDLDLSWAFQVLVSLVYRAGGFRAIVAVKTLMIVVAWGMACAAAKRAGQPAVAVAAMLTAIAAEPRMVERPHLVTFMGIGAVMLMMERRTRWWWFALLAWVWAQFHAGVFFATLILLASGMWRPALACAAVSALTPAGWKLAPYLAWHTGLGSTRIVDEFRHADAWNDPWFFALMGLCAIGFAARRVSARQILPVVIVAPLAWRSVRFVAEWSLLSLPVVAATLQPVWSFRYARAVVAGVALLLIVRRGDASPPGLADDLVPFAAIDFATKNGLRERMYSDLDVGCYLLWEGWPRFRVFQDARLPAYPDEFHRALDETPDSKFDALLRRYGVDAALLNTPDINMRAGAFDPEEWALLWRDDEALIFARRTPKHADAIARYELPWRLRFRFAGGTTAEPMWNPPARSPVPLEEWKRRLRKELAPKSLSR